MPGCRTPKPDSDPPGPLLGDSQNRCSTIPLGVSISRALATRRCRASPDQPADRRRGDHAGRASQNAADHGCSFRSQRRLVVSGEGERVPLPADSVLLYEEWASRMEAIT